MSEEQDRSGLDPRVAYDVRQLVKSRKGKATIIISSHNLQELEEVCDGAAILEVADTGMGISVGDRNHLFERFFRGRRARKVPGIGLGLSIVKAIVNAHGGRISVESRPEQGTTFRVELALESTVPPAALPAMPVERARQDSNLRPAD